MNLVDVIWVDRPPPPRAPVRPHPREYAGEESEAKLSRVRGKLAEAKLDALLVSDPHNLAWAFNLRGGDVGHTPLPLGYALVPREGRPTLFLDPLKVTNEAGAAIGGLADLAPPDALTPALDALGRAGKTVRIDAATGAAALARRIETSGGTPDPGPDPITVMKAVKNAAEIEGARAAHRRDGAAVTRFLAWLAAEAPGQLTEVEAVEKLEAFRLETGRLEDVSFPTIAGAGPNGAIVHYRPTRRTNRRIEPGELLLVDSGGQYRDGTTDITRTVAFGEPTAEMRDRFTRVLRGHIAIARAVFPKGTTGAQIDALARLPLWEAGLDFDHGTGHGVGSFLSVHEGPQRLSKIGHCPAGDRDDRLQRARLLQGRAFRHPDREPRSGRGAADRGRRTGDARLRNPHPRPDRPYADRAGAHAARGDRLARRLPRPGSGRTVAADGRGDAALAGRGDAADRGLRG
jgi:Xaa-Pro aminopeptidase